MAKLTLNIRWFHQNDIPNVLKVEESIYAQPWTMDEFKECLQHKNCIGVLAEHERKIAGYMIYEVHKRFMTILNLATDLNHRRKGVATQLLNTVKDKLNSDRCTSIYSRFHERNDEALNFLISQDFHAVGTIRNYFGEFGDAYELRYQMPMYDQWAYYNRIAKYMTSQ